MWRLFAVILLSASIIAVAHAGEGAPSPEAEAFFEKSIRPQLVENCFSCHGAEKQKGGLRMDSRAALLKGGNGGPAVVPGDPDKSLLIQAIRHEDELAMPPKKPQLSAAIIADFVTWVRSGAPWPGDKSKAQDADAWKKHWAFQPVRENAPPTVSKPQWVKSPVDAFVLAALDAKKLTPSAPADRRLLIRRATFDLTGLPPTLEEVRNFESDTSPDAFSKVVDRLLASPHYGERWGRYWLDVARYADTKGYVYDGRETREFLHAWNYRNWVIDALNSDMPYDQFLLQQIAGDSLAAGDKREPLAAMGFLTTGRRFLGNIHDIIDDRIDVLMRGTQGLSAGCARCHDHKFDPIPTKDYYSLYGIFNNSLERTERLREPEKSEAYAAYEKGLNERIAKLNAAFEKKKNEAMNRYRSRVSQYLVALLDVSKLPSEEFYEITNADDINPSVVRQWQAYTFKNRGNTNGPFAPWLAFAELKPADFAQRVPAVVQNVLAQEALNARVRKMFEGVPPQNMREVAERYGSLLKSVHDEWQAALKKAQDEKRDPPDKLSDPVSEELRLVLYGPESAVAIPSGSPTAVENYFEENTRVELGKLQVEIDKWMINSPGAPPHAVYLEDRPERKISRVFVRGNPRVRGDEAPSRFLNFLGGQEYTKGSGRHELALSIIDKKNPLTARVMVNRVWNWHFGSGLVSTPSDFGVRTPPPSHPELLDFLASRFMERWSIKDLHRMIMLSSTYQQSSVSREDCAQADPENKLLWRMNRQRFDFESLHDTLLSASGKLDLNKQDKPVDLMKEPFPPRRAVYGLIDRTNLPGVMRVFDFPNPDMHSPQRFNTTVPQQALFFMNNPFVVKQAQAIVARPEISSVKETDERIHRLHELLFQRRASERHVSVAREFVQAAASGQPPPAKTVSLFQYGYGEFDEAEGRVKSFTALPKYTGDAWQGGSNWPDEKLGWVRLTAAGGHCGNDRRHDAIRRWVAPADGTISIDGKLSHPHPQGDGVLARVVSSQRGIIGTWTAHNNTVPTKIDTIQVKAGETIDFIANLRTSIDYDEFTWAPLIRTTDKVWDTSRDFSASRPVSTDTLNAWERYVQVLLFSNEFMFID